MIVVADSSPLHYLILVQQVDLLRRLYAEVFVPLTVAAELTVEGSPAEVREWIAVPPPWIRVVHVGSEEFATVSESLDLGERAAIALAERIRADLLLIDETAGRAEARRRQIRVTGTLGVLRAAAEMGHVDVPDVVRRLQATNFYVDEALLLLIFAKWLEE